MKFLLPSRTSVQGLLGLVSLLFCGSGWAQEARVRASLATNDVVWVGQKVTVVIELLAPGIFAGAATFDLPDPRGMLLLPPAEHPTVVDKTIDGRNYTEQRHELSAFPMRAGAQSVPALTVRFAFKRAPLDTHVVPVTVTTPPLPFNVELPPGTEKLGNVISAKELKAEEEWNPEPGQTNVPAGAAFQRTVTFSAPEVSGMVFPPFPAGKIDGLGIYTQQQTQDHSERGTLTGTRREVITYLCQRPGHYIIPAARFIWFDLATRQLRTNEFPARKLTVIPNPAMASAAAPGDSVSPPMTVARPEERRTIIGIVSIVTISFLATLLWMTRRTWKPLLTCFRPVRLVQLNPVTADVRLANQGIQTVGAIR